jgi:hypothetical protein
MLGKIMASKPKIALWGDFIFSQPFQIVKFLLAENSRYLAVCTLSPAQNGRGETTYALTGFGG